MGDSDTIPDRINYPTVTQIIGKYGTGSYDNIPVHVLEQAADRGTEVHAHCSALSRDLFSLEPSPLAEPYVESFRKWWDFQDETGKYPMRGKILMNEERLYDDDLMFSGKADLLLCMDRGTVLLDWKTSASFQKTWPIQIAAYVHLARKKHPEINPTGLILMLKKTGRMPSGKTVRFYTPDELKIYWKHFLELLNMYNYFFRP